MKQSRSLKNKDISRLILFLFITASDVPLFSFSAFYKYCLAVIGFLSLSTSLREKSLTTHRKFGKYLAISSGSFS